MKNKKRETSKKIMLFVCIWFTISMIFAICLFIYSTIHDKSIDAVSLVAFVAIPNTAFASSVGLYMNKSKIENVYKIKKSFMREKYMVLNEMGVLDNDRAQSEIESELTKIENGLDEEETIINQGWDKYDNV